MLVTLHKIVQNANLGDGNVYSDVTHATTIQARWLMSKCPPTRR